MADVFDIAKRSDIMSRVRDKDTGPELAVRRLTFSLGYRYRLHRKDLPGKPDLTFPRLRKVIFVHGCFWHGHHCTAGAPPSSNSAYWLPKLARNKKRDKRNLRALRKLGWKCLVVWECQLKNPSTVQKRIERFLSRNA